ncbi:MAG TPA: PQQ-binding-like beta-propeller repeat protein [Vicinamibacterales bacterium]|nr:PQQ-binding-like beta-propeller repeat protein [Vicinamibacterales bacterium]
MTMPSSRVWLLALAALGCGVATFLSSRPLDAQGLATPSFTDAQATAGKAAFDRNCASCHGANLDDGEFGPPLKGVEFRIRWGAKPLDGLFAALSSMPPAAPDTLGDRTYVNLLAFFARENGVTVGTRELSGEPAALKASALPAAVGGPSGGLTIGVALPPSPSRANPLDRLTPVTDAMLSAPADGEWLTWRRSFDAQGFSPLNQVTRDNVGELRLVWSWALPNGPNEVTPLVHDGVMFVHAYGDKVQAIDAATGDLLWQYSRRLPKDQAPSVKRGIAIYGTRLFVPTSDTHIVALDAKTGSVLWDQAIADAKAGYGLTGGPLVANGKVMVGTTGRAPGGNFIVALDAATGRPAWRMNTIARPGEYGGNSWNGLPLDKRNGASVWVPGSYDRALNLAFFGPAQTYDTGPLRNRGDEGVTNDGLYTDSTLAINVDTGRLVWFFQHQPNDQWDYDWAFERHVVQLPVGGANKSVVVTGGKQAIFDAMEADTGKYLFSMDLGVQNVVKSIDPRTGDKVIDERLVPGDGETKFVCPHAGGAKSWLPSSYNPRTKILYVSLVESCMDLTPVAPGGRGSLSTGVRWSLRPRPNSDGLYGRIQAINLEKRQTVWTDRQRAPMTTGTLATAGGVVFAGALDRTFVAYDDATGARLWQTRLGDVPSNAPISYVVGGRQYIAMVVGNGGAQAATFPALVPEIRNPPDRGASVWVFALPERTRR